MSATASSPHLSLHAASPSRRSAVRAGMLRALPMALGYVPLSFAFGVFALGQGVSPLNMLLMSVLVYAASSQIAAIKLLVAGAPLGSVVATVFVINLRHLLMSSVLAPHLRHFKPAQLGLFAAQLSDEAFATHSLGFANRTPSRSEIFAVNLSLHVAWIVGSLAALLVPTTPGYQAALGLDYTPVAMFIALLVLLIKDSMQVAVAVFSGLLAVLLRQVGLQGWDIIIATAVGATLGTGVHLWISKKSSSPSWA